MGIETSAMESLVMDIVFWQGKKVFITGHTGFKGSWLSLWLQELGADVVGFSLEPPTNPNLFTSADVAKNMTHLLGDIRDFSSIKKAIMEHQPEIIIHMAAQPLVLYSYEAPIETYATNVMGTVHVLEAAKLNEATKVVVNVTSDKCYENKEWHWSYREQDILGGHDPYSNSKACAELVTAAFRHSYYQYRKSVGLASVRAGNVIGGGDWASNRLIPDLMRSMLEKKELVIRYPHALRPWQHVLEPLRGYLELARRMYMAPSNYAEAWNFGPDDHDVKSVGWIVDRVQALWDKLAANHHVAEKPHLHEASYLKLDSSKAKNQLGWRPQWNLETALEKTVRWYQAYGKGQDVRQETRSQINEYLHQIIG